MPYQVITESNGVGVVISFSGAVSGSEVIDLNGRLSTDELFSQCRYQIWDFSGATQLDITIDELRSLTLQDIVASATNPTLKTAIVGQQKLFAGKDRIFQIFEEAWTTYRPEFFLDVKAAREWATGNQT